MFVRWEKRRRAGASEARVLQARLVRSERVAGKPRQKTVAYLGRGWLDKDGVVSHVLAQGRFWASAGGALDQLMLPAEERRAVEAALLLKVPRPSAEAVAEAQKEREEEIAAELAAFKAALGPALAAFGKRKL
jgi:hypothetical protein